MYLFLNWQHEELFRLKPIEESINCHGLEDRIQLRLKS